MDFIGKNRKQQKSDGRDDQTGEGLLQKEALNTLNYVTGYEILQNNCKQYRISFFNGFMSIYSF